MCSRASVVFLGVWAIIVLLGAGAAPIKARESSIGRDLGPRPQRENMVAVENYMREFLEVARSKSRSGDTKTTVYDLELLCAYSKQDGFRRLQETDALSTPNVSRGEKLYEPRGPRREIVSKSGYTFVSAQITLGKTDGLNGTNDRGIQCNEGAFNYFGLKNTHKDGTVYDLECGLCTQYHMSDTFHKTPLLYNDDGKWFIYRSWNRSKQPTDGRPNVVWDPLHQPKEGLASGTRVTIVLSVPEDDMVHVQYSWDGGSYEDFYRYLGPKRDGVGNIVRRVTSMIVGGAGKSLNNRWTQICIKKGLSSRPVAWTAEQTDGKGVDIGNVVRGIYGPEDWSKWVRPAAKQVAPEENVDIQVPPEPGPK